MINEIKVFLKEYGMFIYNTATIIVSVYGLYQLYKVQPLKNKFNALITEILNMLDILESECTEYWCNPNILNRKSCCCRIKAKFKNISTNLSIINEQHPKKVKNIMTYVTSFNDLKDKAMGGNFESSDFRVDSARAEEITSLIDKFKKEIKSI